MFNTTTSREVAEWFINDVKKWRARAATAWSILMTAPALVVYLTLVNISFTSPHSMLIASTSSIFLCPSNWKYLLILAVVISYQAYKTYKYCSVVSQVQSTRLVILTTIIKPSSIIFYGSLAAAGGVATWSLSSLIGGDYKGLTGPCQTESKDICLQEKHLFLVCHGIYLGLMFALGFLVTNQGYMQFPLTQQAKYFQVRTQLYRMVKGSVIHTLKQLKYFYLIYYLFGSLHKSAIITVLKIQESPDVQPINSWRGVLDIGLFWQVLLAGSLVRSLFTLSALLYKVYQTQPYTFPVESNLESDRNRCLPDSLQCLHSTQVQFLGYLDLSLLSRYCRERRSQIFSLSQPGGHAHNWNSISFQCLEELESLTNEITLYNDTVMGGKPGKTHNSDRPLMGSGDGSQSHSSFGIPTENLSFRGSPTENYKTDLNQHVRTPTFADKFLARIKQRKAVSYFLQPLPDTGSRKLFAASQKHTWIVQVLSNLCTASYIEDSYGVVQKSLPAIIGALLKLQEALEKHFKLSPSIVRRATGDNDKDVAFRFTLKSEVKSALYRIATTFEKHLSSLDMPQEQSKRLASLTAFKE